MTPASWYACVHVRELPAQALLRVRQELQSAAVVVVEGKAPVERVCSYNRAAAALGLQAGMTRVEVESYAAVTMLLRDLDAEAKTRAVLMNGVAKFSPQVQWVAGVECSLVVEIGGVG